MNIFEQYYISLEKNKHKKHRPKKRKVKKLKVKTASVVYADPSMKPKSEKTLADLRKAIK